ncbi:hypothetical protein PanWU01x14_342650, partial [Parasponia andersonii]
FNFPLGNVFFMYDLTRMMTHTLSDYESSMKKHFGFYNSNDDIKAVKKKPTGMY